VSDAAVVVRNGFPARAYFGQVLLDYWRLGSWTGDWALEAWGWRAGNWRLWELDWRLGTRHWRLGAGGSGLEAEGWTGHWRLKAGLGTGGWGLGLEAGNWRLGLEAGNWRLGLEAGGWGLGLEAGDWAGLGTRTGTGRDWWRLED
jgi:hypothetical protein